ncbi:MAG: hypothetical protein Q8M07_07930, partial [Prosthecobacter sp.]|nr:hypothetical protein [Prosthecobacter sp.]
MKTFPRSLRPRLCLVLFQLASFTAAGIADEAPDLLGIVRKYADAMIDQCRSQLPEPKSPLFPI